MKVFKSKQEVKTEPKDLSKRQEGESVQAYNERVPVNLQPLAEPITKNYLGQKRD